MAQEEKWYKLDNAAKLFPATTRKRRSNVFRVAMIMREKVRADVLQQAVNDLKPRFPMYYLKMKRGLFWFYYEQNEGECKVLPESPYICPQPSFHQSNGYLFNVFCYEYRIVVEMYHALTDANGLVEFLKAIVYRYLCLLGHSLESDGTILTLDTEPQPAEEEDSFTKNYTPQGKDRAESGRAYKLGGDYFETPVGGGIINGKFPVEELLKRARERNCTATAYLSAVLTQCILRLKGEKEKHKKHKKPRAVKLFIPVNMRKYYHSKTLRNFVLYVYTDLPERATPYSFDEIVEIVKNQIIEGTKPENLQKTLNANVAIERARSLYFIPLFVKQLAIRIGYKFIADRKMTCALSNIGDVKLPPAMQEHVRYMEWAVNAFKQPTVSVLSNNGVMSVNFMRPYYETDLEKLFFRFLADEGIHVTVESNLWESQAGV